MFTVGEQCNCERVICDVLSGMMCGAVGMADVHQHHHQQQAAMMDVLATGMTQQAASMPSGVIPAMPPHGMMGHPQLMQGMMGHPQQMQGMMGHPQQMQGMMGHPQQGIMGHSHQPQHMMGSVPHHGMVGL